MKRLLPFLILINLVVYGCVLNNQSFTPAVSGQRGATATIKPTVTTESLFEKDAAGSAPVSSSTPMPTAQGSGPEPTVTPSTFSVEKALEEVIPPVRDDFQLAQRFGRDMEVVSGRSSSRDNPLEIGAQEKFNILNVVDNTVGEIEAELLAVSDHAYFWFDTNPDASQPDPDQLLQSAAAFDDIYDKVVMHFGSENNPGIDDDPRLHVVNASPMALCGVSVDTADQCFLAGLVQPADLLPVTVDPRSNEREMFVMNSHRFGGEKYLGVLAHEFRHMIEDNYDISDTDWEKEGSATLAAELAGYQVSGVQRANMFLENPDQQLNSWTEENTAPYYGQGYLFNRYIFDRLGREIYLQFATNPLPGLLAIDWVAEQNGLDLDGVSIWLDWLVALAVHNDPHVPSRYDINSEDLNTAAMDVIIDLPIVKEDTVHQFATDYYRLPHEGSEIIFEGMKEVSLLPTQPISGQYFWITQRGNNSNPRLTREVDLTGVTEASFIYNIFTDIEKGYDFAYVSISADGGQSWQPLVGKNMQGLDPADNPAGSAFSERFYSNRDRKWIEEEIDLTLYTGNMVLLRFEYVTDPILTYGGLALDDIRIPEIGFFDNVENDDHSWKAEGFIRVTDKIPQIWHLRLITFPDDKIVVEDLKVDQEGKVKKEVTGNEGDHPPILIIAASAPTTLTPALYQLRINP